MFKLRVKMLTKIWVVKVVLEQDYVGTFKVAYIIADTQAQAESKVQAHYKNIFPNHSRIYVDASNLWDDIMPILQDLSNHEKEIE